MKITDDIREHELNVRATTSELDETVREMRMSVVGPPRSNSSNSKTNSHLINEMGLLQDEMKRFQARVNEKFHGNKDEIKNEILDKLNKDEAGDVSGGAGCLGSTCVYYVASFTVPFGR